MIKCPHCKELITEAYVMKHLPKSIIVSEGARGMSLKATHKLTPERASKMAKAKWKKHEERLRRKEIERIGAELDKE